jgi:hypothetical protein
MPPLNKQKQVRSFVVNRLMGEVKKICFRKTHYYSTLRKKKNHLKIFNKLRDKRFELHVICFSVYCVFDCKCDTTTTSSKSNDKYRFRSFFYFVYLLHILSFGNCFLFIHRYFRHFR